MTLVCGCGQQLNAPGATPGRVGKCPRCGSLLRVAADLPDGSAPEPGSPPARPAPRRPGRPAAGEVYQPARTASPTRSGRPTRADGLVVVPLRAEATLAGSWAYPLRNASGLALLAMVPPLLWLGSIPLFSLVPVAATAPILTMLVLVGSVPQLLFLAYVLGHVLLFLGDVVVTSCLGHPALPRQASWMPGEVFAAWGRWLLAGVFGGVAGGLPALIYWVNCGDVDWLDRVVLVDLALPGLAYAQMALVVALIHESAWAVAHPGLIGGAIFKGGWAYLGPCLLTAGALGVMVGLMVACVAIRNPVLQAVACWLWWVVGLYLALVSLRHLGLFCRRRRVLAVEVRPGS